MAEPHRGVEEEASVEGRASGASSHDHNIAETSSILGAGTSAGTQSSTQLPLPSSRPQQSSSIAATTAMEQGQTGGASNSQGSGQDDTSSAAPSASATATPTTPMPASTSEVRQGARGFAALVDAFMAGFRQSMQAHQPYNAAEQPPTPMARVPSQGENRSQGEADTSSTDRASNPSASVAPSFSTDGTSSRLDEAAAASGRSDVEPTLEGQHRTGEESPAAADGPGLSASNSDANEQGTPRTLFFRMPFSPVPGQTAILAFHPGPIPVPTDSNLPPPTYGADRPAHLGPERGNGQASGYHLPAAPIFVPLGASPLPFSFLFDTQTHTAWPIGGISTGPPGSMPEAPADPNTPQFVAGPPFHIALNINFGPPPEPPRPDPERAARFVASLERADAELRSRMARLGMGDIGDYGGRQGNEGGESAALGCGICLDEYPDEDRPEWIGGQDSIDEEVVAVPCAGHHTLHHRCLYEWLATSPPNQWTCPFCRAPLDKEKVEQSATRQQQQQSAAQRDQEMQRARTPEGQERQEELKKAFLESKGRSLREEVRLRERGRGWRCDSPACLPRYPGEGEEEDGTVPALTAQITNSARKNGATEATTSLITLLPCRHKMHVDCLCTSMKLEQAESGSLSSDEEAEAAEDEEEGDEEAHAGRQEDRVSTGSQDEVEGVLAQPNKSLLPTPPASNEGHHNKETVGKWVTCPACRHESWAELPARRKPKRSTLTTGQIGNTVDT